MKKWEIVAIGAILVVGAALRLYNLPQTLMFRGDQGRDAIIAKNILKEGDIALIGPVTSVGNMYLGPFYYYFMVPFLAMTYPDPVGPAYGVAILNIISIYLLYWVGKKVFEASTGILAALMLAIMPAAVSYSRFSWNPNIAPFFSILIFYFLVNWWQKRSLKTFFLISFLTGLLIQTHYVSLTVVGLVGLLWLIRLNQKKYRLSFKEMLVGLGGFGITISPLIAFDLRHNHLISRQFIGFFTSTEKHIALTNVVEHINLVADKAIFLITNLMYNPASTILDRWLLSLSVVLVIWRWLRRKKIFHGGDLILSLWLLLAIVGISMYSHTTFIHYLTYCLPIIALFWARITTAMCCSKKYCALSFPVAGIIIVLEIMGLSQLKWNGLGTSVVMKTVTQAGPYITPPYNITLLSDDKDYKGMSYRYFFETNFDKPQSIDDYGLLSTLVVIDETFLPDPRTVPIYELDGARNFKLERKIEIPNGPWVYIYKKG